MTVALQDRVWTAQEHTVTHPGLQCGLLTYWLYSPWKSPSDTPTISCPVNSTWLFTTVMEEVCALLLHHTSVTSTALKLGQERLCKYLFGLN